MKTERKNKKKKKKKQEEVLLEQLGVKPLRRISPRQQKNLLESRLLDPLEEILHKGLLLALISE